MVSPVGLVTPISIVLRAATGIVTPYTADVGVAYRITPYTTKKSHSHGGFLRRSQGHRQFSSAVTRSQAVFGRSQIVTPVAALSTAHIGVTTPCGGTLIKIQEGESGERAVEFLLLRYQLPQRILWRHIITKSLVHTHYRSRECIHDTRLTWVLKFKVTCLALETKNDDRNKSKTAVQ